MAKVGQRLVLIHWHREEAQQRLAQLSRNGFRVQLECTGEGAAALRKHRLQPPAAFVIDLTRQPARGRAVGIWLRQQKSLRRVPLIFAGGASDKVEKTRELLPDAVFCAWRRVVAAIRRALAEPVLAPAVPATMASYSGTPLVKKLGVRSDSVLALLGAPVDFALTLGELPGGVRVRHRAQGKAERVLLFSHSTKDLVRRFPAAARATTSGGGLWLLWPKKSSGVDTDLSERFVRQHGLDGGWVDYKICAVDEVWSGLLFARRRSSTG